MYDVAIIGAGIVGGSIFRELTKYNSKVVIIDKEKDVAMGTSKANSAIVHSGYDPEAGTLMAKYNVEGSKMFPKLCKDLSVPFKQNGSLIIAFDDEDLKTVEELYNNGVRNGVEGLRILDREEVLKMEPNLKGEVKGALYAPTGGIVGAYELTIAIIENGIDNGGEIRLGSEVKSIDKKDDVFKVELSSGEVIEAKRVINAAGVYADKIHNMICDEAFTIHPRKGEYFILDKNQGDLVTRTIFQCPTKMGKGVLVTPTVHGNLLVGPDSTDGENKEDLSTESSQLDFIKETSLKTTDKVNFRESIRNFAGLRAISDRKDFIVEEAKDVKGFIDVAGIKSPGLTSAPAIAVDVVEMIKGSGLNLEENKNFDGTRKQIHFIDLSPEEKAKLIKEDSRYGRIICRCENITEGEIVDSINRTLGARTVDGVKRRCRPGCGRCQGGFCGPRVQEIIARELKMPMEDVMLDKENSYILTGETK
ncbi:NAD(P)/FAD-dependent oxidoreductase [Clostridium fallax]|uniref:Glycerol-3-phosphate dehydrogenase n=1 Tax=Clostridium fallax TaxID=1533 RepID=A0A1M4Y173_9CLOT|nr:NAD(P)/FAD-dependent oxidoreductase [Clostridium fallax]SHE99439.1 glycerol-3-phosphate dehydrogenase [Clostridium fallax]SQB07766.1 glycerol-3-phosphate dehydrogenase [Clostridium fallax]